MRIAPVAALTPGLRLARAVHGDRGDLLLNVDVPLTARYIELLRERGHRAVYVLDSDTEDVTVAEVLSEQLRRHLTAGLWIAFDTLDAVLAPFRDENRLEEAAVGSDELARALRGRSVYPELAADADRLVDEMLEGPNEVRPMPMRPTRGYLIAHAIDSTAVALQVARKIGYPRHDLRRLAIASLMHDVGMIAVARSIIEKRGRLSAAEAAEVRLHPAIGYQILRVLRPRDVLGNHVAYQHHERQDGKGYPRGLAGSNAVHRSRAARLGGSHITLDAEIVAVADTYAALAGGRLYRGALPPDHLVRVISRLAGSHLNREIVGALLTLVPVYPLGTDVFLKTGPYRAYRGIVVRVHREALDRPTIRLLWNDRRERIQPLELDLRGCSDALGCIPFSGYLVPPSGEGRDLVAASGPRPTAV